MAMNDALIPGDTTSVRFQQEIDSAYSSHRFGAIILDEDKVFSGVTGDTQHLPHYRFATTLFHTPNVYLSRIGDAPTRPQFVYLPDR
jgi:hypothetical protein